ncbi:hypothetical protein BGW80DRAFT_1343487 [Lactifluus volemus]|nr:hypothetical protein BGW80DRAFT_1343487 [Lactifluus volemus]
MSTLHHFFRLATSLLYLLISYVTRFASSDCLSDSNPACLIYPLFFFILEPTTLSSSGTLPVLPALFRSPETHTPIDMINYI